MKFTVIAFVGSLSTITSGTFVLATVAISQPVQAQPFCAVQNCQSSVINEWSPTIPQIETNIPNYINAPLVTIPVPEPYEWIEPTPTPESLFEPGQFPVYQPPIYLPPVYENPYFTPNL
jgi:hypothetical protein